MSPIEANARQKQINENSRAQKVHKMENENTRDERTANSQLARNPLHVMLDSSAICTKSVRRIRVYDVCDCACACVCFAVHMYNVIY